MKKAFRKSLKRQASLGYFKNYNKSDSQSSSTNPLGSPILWQALAKKYRFNYPRDWYQIEAHWLDQIESFQEQPIDCPGRDGKMNNSITRVSQCNESNGLCNSLPKSFIVPKDLKDFTLMNDLSTVIKDHRVPVISYCCPIEYRRNFIIRCASSDQETKVIDILNVPVKPLEVFRLDLIAPSLELVTAAHKRLCEACRPKDEDQATNFVSKSGKWLNIISSALKIVNQIAITLLTKASVILIEDDDNGWNSLVSSLIQLLLEPHRRTIVGFESLISKEWIYLSRGGCTNNRPQPDILFNLFLDCTYQIYIQNTSKFEFTSEYLKYIFEAQFLDTPPSTPDHSSHNNKNLKNNNNISSNPNSNYYSQRMNNVMSKSKTSYTYDEESDIIEELASYKQSSLSMVQLNLKNGLNKDRSLDTMCRLESGYNLTMFNPFYKLDKDSQTILVYDHIANIKLWTTLYLRWMQPRINYGCVEEILYLQVSCPEVENLKKVQNE